MGLDLKPPGLVLELGALLVGVIELMYNGPASRNNGDLESGGTAARSVGGVEGGDPPVGVEQVETDQLDTTSSSQSRKPTRGKRYCWVNPPQDGQDEQLDQFVNRRNGGRRSHPLGRGNGEGEGPIPALGQGSAAVGNQKPE